MSSTTVQRLPPVLPVELLRIIFELSFEEDRQGIHLLVVSRSVQQWLEPLLYRTIIVYGGQRAFKLFCALLYSNRSASRYVTRLVLGCQITDLLVRTVTACKSLQSFALPGHHLNTESTPHFRALQNVDLPCLQRFSLDVYSLRHPSDFTSLKMLRSVTHLQLFNRPLEIEIWNAIQQLSNLTHLWVQLPYRRTIPDFVKRTLVPRLSTSIKLAVVTVNHSCFTEVSPGWIRKSDKRVILSTGDLDLLPSEALRKWVLLHGVERWEKTWGRLPAGEIDGWSEAERLQAQIALESV
ncbi:hypothetical protein C8J56DRAFT_977120 [Mycena floridula]|nr:hypothetical protein C8J56DRAFT_977120 [Mycena floridula]